MKIRNGFVSNSSSSSFILFGFVKEENGNYEKMCKEMFSNEDLEKWEKEYDSEWVDIWWEHKDDGEFDVISDESFTYIGEILADDEYLEPGSYSLEDLMKMKEKLEKKYPGEELEIHFGTYPC